MVSQQELCQAAPPASLQCTTAGQPDTRTAYGPAAQSKCPLHLVYVRAASSGVTPMNCGGRTK